MALLGGCAKMNYGALWRDAAGTSKLTMKPCRTCLESKPDEHFFNSTRKYLDCRRCRNHKNQVFKNRWARSPKGKAHAKSYRIDWLRRNPDKVVAYRALSKAKDKAILRENEAFAKSSPPCCLIHRENTTQWRWANTRKQWFCDLCLEFAESESQRKRKARHRKGIGPIISARIAAASQKAGFQLTPAQFFSMVKLNNIAGKPKGIDELGWTCAICSKPHSDPGFFDIHHVIPKSEGGPNDIENKQILCPNCHREVTLKWIASKFRKFSAGGCIPPSGLRGEALPGGVPPPSA